MKPQVTLFWLRRYLRLYNHKGLYFTLQIQDLLSIFIFDTNLNFKLLNKEARIPIIDKLLVNIQTVLQRKKTSLYILKGKPIDVFQKLTEEIHITDVYYNADYEPYAIEKDTLIMEFMQPKEIKLYSFIDYMIFSPNVFLKSNKESYITVNMPYTQWKIKFSLNTIDYFPSGFFFNYFLTQTINSPCWECFNKLTVKLYNLINDTPFTYDQNRNIPNYDASSYSSPYLRWGTLSVRKACIEVQRYSQIFFSELLGLEFFIQILYHFPKVITQRFKLLYNNFSWLYIVALFQKWIPKLHTTTYAQPIVEYSFV